MQSEQISIDQLEDQIIDHPDASTRKDLLDTSLDETFQKKLNERAEQIKSNQEYDNGGNRNDASGAPGQNGNGQINYQFLINKSHLDYKYHDYSELEKELSEWFTFNDLNVIDLKNLAKERKGSLEEIIRETVTTIQDKSVAENDEGLVAALGDLIYLSFGEYGQRTIKSEQLRHIIQNNRTLVSHQTYKPLISILKVFIDSILNQESSENAALSSGVEASYFKVLTLLYFMINVTIQSSQDSQQLQESKAGFQKILAETDLLSYIIKFIEHWKWKPNHTYRIRYLILLSWKLILFEMGDSDQLKVCNDYLIKKHNIQNKQEKGPGQTKLTCSPLDYFTFREDILDKYPLFQAPDLKAYDFKSFKDRLDQSDLESNSELNSFSASDTNSEPNGKQSPATQTHYSENVKLARDSLRKPHNYSESIESKFKEFMAMNTYSNSLSNLIESPRTYKSHTILSQLPAQTVHIATPIPSPTLMASDYMSGGEKIRRSYQINQSMPFIYPSLIGDGSQGEIRVPLAIEEADQILRDSIYESYSNKRLWFERQEFMKQERGYVSEYGHKEDTPEKSNKTEGAKQEDSIKNKSQSPIESDSDILDGVGEENPAVRSIRRVEKFYKENLIRLNTFVQVLVETIRSNKLDYNLNFPEWELNPETSYLSASSSSNFDDETKSKIEFVLMSQLEVLNVKEVALKASTGIISLLLKWFKISHVLKYYYLTSLLFDQQFFTTSLDYISRSLNNSNLQSFQKDEEITDYEILINQNKILNPSIVLPKFDFFNNCLGRFPQDYRYKFINKDIISQLPKIIDENGISNTYIKNFNENFCFILTNLLNITNKILITGITQRIFTLNELKPSELYKTLIINYENDFISKPILKILKKLIPYQGRKWKSVNMDLISQIYLNLPLSLKDNWLSGKDLESDFNNSYDQEISLRALLQFYNVRRYPSEMEKIGYQINDDEDIPLLSLGDEEEIYW